MDLIGHNYSSASKKLRKAVALNSSAACSTLARLLYKGVNTEEESTSISPPSPPTVSYSQKGNSSRFSSSGSRTLSDLKKDRQEAARLFVRGLEIELAKQLKGSESPSSRLNLSRKSSRDTREGMYGSASEEEGAEGDFFNLERALDLVVGVCLFLKLKLDRFRNNNEITLISLFSFYQLTDCYRYGILQAHTLTNTSELDNLWIRGGKAAALALLHPGVSLSSSEPVQLSTSPLGFGGAPLLRSNSSSRPRNTPDPTSRAASPKRTTTSRSYTHASTSVPAVASFVPSSFQSLAAHHLPPNLKLRLTIQIHLYYLLGLQNWPAEKLLSQHYWQEILRIADSIGAGVGTKEGDEIVFSAAQRLKLSKGEVLDDGMNSKSRSKRSGSVLDSSLVLEDINGKENIEDALQDIWREKSEGLALEKSIKESRKGKSWKGKGKEVEREDQNVSPRNNSISVFNSFYNSSSLSSQPIVASPTPISSPSVTNSVKIAKFHFATISDYPSPPETPNPSPPSTSRSRSDLNGVKELARTPSNVNFPVELNPPAFPQESQPIPPSFPKFRRRGSASSFQPPQLLPRIHSSASISTLPPDFFSSKSINNITGLNWQSGSRATTGRTGDSVFNASPMSKSSNVTNMIQEEPAVGGRAWLKSRFKSIKSSFTRQEKKTTATSILKKVLNRDDESAGPGMYWGDESEGTEDALEILDADQAMADEIVQDQQEVLLPPPSPTPSAGPSNSKRTRKDLVDTSPRLQSQRSFVDVTSPRAAGTPRMTYTPPTPRDPLELFPSPSNDQAISSSSRINLSLSISPATSISKKSKLKRFDSGIDPMLLELERASRVGVRTKCFTCGKKGLNYPATRNGMTYCTRECRMVKK